MTEFTSHVIRSKIQTTPSDDNQMYVGTDIDYDNYRVQIVSKPGVPGVMLQAWQINAHQRAGNWKPSPLQKDINDLDRAFGTELLSRLLPTPELRGAFGHLCSDPKSEIILDVSTDDQDLSTYPWEACAHANWQALGIKEPINQVVVVRSPAPYENRWSAEGLIKILVAGVSPVGIQAVNFDKECGSIGDAMYGIIKNGGNIQFDILPIRETTIQLLREYVVQYKPHVVHMVTHGEYGQQYLETSDGQPILIPSSELSNTLRFGSDNLSIFVSTACMAMQESPSENTWGLGKRLAGIVPISIGMQISISEDAALAFTKEFYSSLAASFTVLDAFAQARERIRHERPGSPEWIAPVLYRGTQINSHLFSPEDLPNFLYRIITELDAKLDTLRDSQFAFEASLNPNTWKELYNSVNNIERRVISGLEKGSIPATDQQKSFVWSMKEPIITLRELLFNICFAFERLKGRDKKLGSNISRAIVELNALRNNLAQLYSSYSQYYK